MSKSEFYMRVGKPKAKPVEYVTSKQLASLVLANQVVTGKLLADLYNTLRDLEGVKHDTTKDMMETRLTRINQNGLKQLLQLIELHNARSNLCASILKEPT